MKNYMKKLIVGLFAFAVLLTAGSVSATEVWNGMSNDCPTLTIGNYTTNTGFANPCWNLTSVNASPGDKINVRIYYHNTSSQTATNVRLRLNAPTGSTNSTHSFSASITSDQGSLSSGTVTVSIPSSQTLTLGSTLWYPNQSQSPSSLPGGQSGSEIVNNGISLGSVASGWSSQGSAVVSFQIDSNNNGGTCQDTSATNYGGSLPCTYFTQSNCTISNFTVNGSTTTTIQSGNSARFNWNTDNCTSVNVSGPNLYSSNLSGSQTIYPTTSGTYVLTAYGYNGGTRTRTVYVEIDGNNNSCYINNFTGNGSTTTTIQSGNPVNLVWNTTGCTSVNVSGTGMNSNNYSGSQTVYPTVSSNYTITAYGQNGNSPSRTVYVNVNQIVPVFNACAVTTVATNATQGSATLNGLLTNASGSSYFEYGRTVNLGSQTVTRASNGNFSEVITGLAPNTIYYFRLVSNCGGGLSYGKIEFFQTLGAQVQTIRQVIVQGNTVIGTQSPIMLKIENRYQYIAIGDTVDYTVTYKNIGKSLLTNPVVQVIVPQGILITNASAGTYSNETNTLTVPINDLRPGQDGVIYLQGLVNSISSNTAQIVTTAILVYTSPNGAQENAIAYVLNNPKDMGSVLGASAFWSGLWNMGLIGWLLLLILILLIVLLTRRYYTNKSVTHTTGPSGASHTTTTHY